MERMEWWNGLGPGQRVGSLGRRKFKMFPPYRVGSCVDDRVNLPTDVNELLIWSKIVRFHRYLHKRIHGVQIAKVLPAKYNSF